jgi:glutaredoxin
MSARISFVVLLVAALAVASCSKSSGGTSTEGASFVLKDDTTGLLLTWIDEKGDFHTEQRVGDVPLVGRDAVRVQNPEKEVAPEKVFLADLRSARPDGTYPVKEVPRSEFEGIALTRREKKGPTLAQKPQPSGGPAAPTDQGGVQPADPNPTGRPAAIIYGAEWCGPCHEAAAYFTKKGVGFVEKDVEKDRNAADEMHTKLTKAGLRDGKIPVLDVRGKVMVGFNARSVDAALGQSM